MADFVEEVAEDGGGGKKTKLYSTLTIMLM